MLKKILQHDFHCLVGLAGLLLELKEQKEKDTDFAANWAYASEWSPDARYEDKDMTSAQAIIEAIGNQKSGVLQWIKMYW